MQYGMHWQRSERAPGTLRGALHTCVHTHAALTHAARFMMWVCMQR
jgi:hypothetical protein